MKILVACEYSGTVREAFNKLGHDAMSCDLLPTDIKGNHYEGDILDVLYNDWDMIIAFPPCTHLAVSGTKYFAQKIADGRQQQGIDFFMLFANHPCKMIAIENPVGIMSSKWRKPDQIIQPFEYGHPESKKTCLWLKNLPKLKETNNVYEHMMTLPIKERTRIHWLGSNKSKERSVTYQGIADAISEQWF